MSLNTFPIVVGVRVFVSIAGVYDICCHNVCTISIKIKSQPAKHVMSKKSENSFVQVG